MERRNEQRSYFMKGTGVTCVKTDSCMKQKIWHLSSILECAPVYSRGSMRTLNFCNKTFIFLEFKEIQKARQQILKSSSNRPEVFTTPAIKLSNIYCKCEQKLLSRLHKSTSSLELRFSPSSVETRNITGNEIVLAVCIPKTPDTVVDVPLWSRRRLSMTTNWTVTR